MPKRKRPATPLERFVRHRTRDGRRAIGARFPFDADAERTDCRRGPERSSWSVVALTLPGDASHPAVLEAGRADRARLCAMLSRAFADDPAMTFLFPDPVQRARRMPRLFALLFDTDVNGGMRLTTAGGEAATLWRGPGRIRTNRGDMWRHALPLAAVFGTALRRAVTLSDAITAHMPAGDYWYLHLAGCEPALQGRGLGAAVIRAGLSRAAGRLPCYLETATQANVGFYNRLGFAVTDEWCVPRGGPRFWSMVRSPD